MTFLLFAPSPDRLPALRSLSPLPSADAPASCRTRIALNLKGVEYDQHDIGLRTGALADANGRAQVLAHPAFAAAYPDRQPGAD